MKKIISIITLIALVCLALTACGGESAPQEESGQVNEEVKQQETPAAEEKLPEELSAFLNTKIGKFYSRFAAGEMTMEYKTVVEGMEMRVVTATRDGKSYSESFVDGVSSGVNIIEGETMYTVLHDPKMVMKMPLRADMAGMTAEIIEEDEIDAASIVSGEQEVGGRTYDTEELVVDGIRTVYCFEGDELRFILAETEGMEITMEIVSVSDSADPALFDVPADYTLMEM